MAMPQARLSMREPGGRRAVALVGLVACVASGCGGEAENGTTAGRFEERVGVSLSSETWVFVVDAAGTAAAGELRGQFAARFEDVGAEVCDRDPADWNPMRRVGAVVRASRQSEPLDLMGPLDDASLVVSSNRATSDDLRAWSTAVANAIVSVPPATGPNTVLATLNDALSLLSGGRAPASASEQTLVQETASTSTLVIALLSSREDESPLEPEAYAIRVLEPLSHFDFVVVLEAVVPRAEPCADSCGASPRFQAWQAASTGGIELTTWPSEGSDLLDSPPCGTSIPACIPEPRALPDGSVACRVYVEGPTDLPCSEGLGWLPADDAMGTCEVRQLEGSARRSCETDLQCTECEPGFCFTTVPELASECLAQGKARFPRIIAGGAGSPPRGFRVVCEYPLAPAR